MMVQQVKLMESKLPRLPYLLRCRIAVNAVTLKMVFLVVLELRSKYLARFNL
jgi:hypothetical protein